MKKLCLLLLCTLTLLIPHSLFANSIGYVDMQKTFFGYEEAQKAQEKIQQKQEDFQKKFEKGQKKVQTAREENKTEKKINELITKLEKELTPQKEELVKLNQDLTLKLKGDIISATKEVAKEYNIDIVLDKQVILTGGFDMTDYVLEKLNN
jgi:Skp family chaperone for outer membrane proteins